MVLSFKKIKKEVMVGEGFDTHKAEKVYLNVNLKQFFLSILTTSILLLLLSAVGIVPAGYRGVVLRLGAVTDRILPEGVYVVIPAIEKVELMDVQIHAYSVDCESASKDLQDVKTIITLNYSLIPEKVARVYQTLRKEYETRIIQPAVQESVKAATAQFDAERLIVERPIVKEKIESLITDRLQEHGIKVDTISITDFKFSAEFSKAIEAKVTASQLALKAERDLARVKMEAQQKITSAQAEAEALRLQKQQVTPELIELRRIEAQMKALDKWNGKLPDIITGTAPVPIIDVFKNTTGGKK